MAIHGRMGEISKAPQAFADPFASRYRFAAAQALANPI